jgi:hypothetical protein
MIRRFVLFLAVIVVLSTAGCTKETYDMKRLSKKEHLSPTMAISAVKGNVTFSNLKLDVNIRINSLQIIDTIDNFFKVEGLDKDSPVRPENFDMLGAKITAINGYPLNVSLQMSLYNSSNGTIENTLNEADILAAAPVNGSGKVSAVTEVTKDIVFTRSFLSSIPVSDKIIFQFTFNTPGSTFVSIYSDYIIYFKVALVMKPVINLK